MDIDIIIIVMQATTSSPPLMGARAICTADSIQLRSPLLLISRLSASVSLRGSDLDIHDNCQVSLLSYLIVYQ